MQARPTVSTKLGKWNRNELTAAKTTSNDAKMKIFRLQSSFPMITTVAPSACPSHTLRTNPLGWLR